MARKTPKEIIDLVEAQIKVKQTLFDRMDNDYKLYRLETFDAGEDYFSHTSNSPMTYADKIVSWGVSATVNMRIPAIGGVREQREADSRKERFLIGCLNAADELLELQFLPSLREQMVFHIALRGMTFGRCLLVKKRINGQEVTHVDITPWDPRHVFFEIGPNGFAWICYRVKKTRAQIKAEWGVDVPNAGDDLENDALFVYDYYDEEHNTAVMQDRTLKQSTRHGSPRTPAWGAVVPTAPPIQSENVGDTSGDYGESVYKANRAIYRDQNFIMSVYLELVSRQRQPPYTLKSREGNKTLPEDPSKTGAEIALSETDDFEYVKLVETTKDAGILTGLLAGEDQRGAVPYSSYGQQDFQLSGFAINSLKQGIDAPLQPRLSAVRVAHKQITGLLSDQYQTGAFDPLTVSGRDRNRRYFSEEITPESIRDAGTPEIKVFPDLPQDDISNVAMAQMLREGDNPLAADIFIRGNILGYQDPDEMEDAILEQQAKKVLPEALLYTLGVAAERRGEHELASFYATQLLQLLGQQQLAQQLAQEGVPTPAPAPQGGAQNGGRPTVNPMAAPPAALGQPPPTPTPPVRALPPGSPRPGARV